nr:MAG TPA: hypothetical protein [Bacteriophage sp.]
MATALHRNHIFFVFFCQILVTDCSDFNTIKCYY